MLEPENRHLLLDALRPPPGHELDHAVGTTFSLDLMSLLAAPLGFALFDRESSDGRLIADPIALIEAVRRYADRIDIFCQAGQIAIPREHRAIVTYLESSIHEVVPPNPEAIFHPKVWIIRYRQREDGHKTYRLLCLSRNLTFDRSWDTVLCLEGESKADGSGDRKLSEFVRYLPELSVRGTAPERVEPILQMAKELQSVVFSPPEGFDRLAFWPMGVDGEAWPFAGVVDRLLVISPFLTQGCLARLARKGTDDVIVSRAESFDLVGRRALAHFGETMVINPTTLTGEPNSTDHATPEDGIATDESIAERAGVELQGLHAKLYVADVQRRARIWTGSANATDAGFGGNVEFLVELEGPKARCGIDATVGTRTDGVGLRKLLEPYRPSNEDARELTVAEQIERRLDVTRRAVARLRFVATIAPDNTDAYLFRLRISPGPDTRRENWWADALDSATFRCRPLSLGPGYFRSADAVDSGVEADFGTVSFDRLTSFFVIELRLEVAGAHGTVAFVVNAELVGAPDDRRERTLIGLLQNGRDLIRFLLLLLDQIGADDQGDSVDVLTGDQAKDGTAWLFAQWQALFEPMVRALSAEPARLDEIDRLVTELQATDAGKGLLPPGWQDVWGPIWQARERMRRP